MSKIIHRKLGILLLVTSLSLHAIAQRETLSLNQNWNFRFSHQVEKNSSQRIDLPHTWNAQDALSGKMD